MIVRVAIVRDGVLYPGMQGERHHDVLHFLYRAFGSPNCVAMTQGFVDEHGTFYDRHAALDHAIACGQRLRDPLSAPQHGLFSEDVW